MAFNTNINASDLTMETIGFQMACSLLTQKGFVCFVPFANVILMTQSVCLELIAPTAI